MKKFKDQNDNFDVSDLNDENQDVFSSLGTKNNKNELDLKLKKAKVGGYSKSSVQDYVADMKTTLTQMKINLEQQVYDLTAEKATVSQECKYLREKLQKAQQDYEKAQGDMKSLEDEYVEYCNGFKQREKELEDDNNTLKCENGELKSQIEKCQDAVNEINKYKKELEEKQLEIDRLNNCLEEVNRIKAEECGKLKDNIEKLQIKLKSQAEEVNMEELDELKTRISELDNKNGNLLAQLAKTKEEFERVKRENALKMKEMQENSTNNDSSKANIESELMNFLEKLSFAKESPLTVNNQNLPVQNSTQVYKNQNAQNNLVNEQNTYSDKAYIELEEKFSTLHMHFLNIQEENRKVKSEKSVLENILKKYQQKERDFAFAVQQNSDYKNQITSLQQAVSEILSQMEEQTSEMKSFAKAEEEKRVQMQQAIKERTNLQLRNVELMDEIARLENIIEKTTSEKEELAIELEKEKQTARVINVPEKSFVKSQKEDFDDNYELEKKAVGEVYKRADEFEKWINDKKTQLLV